MHINKSGLVQFFNVRLEKHQFSAEIPNISFCYCVELARTSMYCNNPLSQVFTGAYLG